MITSIAYLLIGIATLIIYGNWVLVARHRFRKQRSSLVPFIGGVLGFIGCLVHPDIPWPWGRGWALCSILDVPYRKAS